MSTEPRSGPWRSVAPLLCFLALAGAAGALLAKLAQLLEATHG